MSRIPYSSAVGSLMYAMVCSRPDLSHALSVVRMEGQSIPQCQNLQREDKEVPRQKDQAKGIQARR